MIKLTVSVELPFDNEIQFFDVCKGTADKLNELGEQSLHDGDCEQFVGQTFHIHAANDDAEFVGTLAVTRTR